MSFIYIGQPYSHPDAQVREHRFLAAEEYTHELLLRGDWCYSPIVHCHEMAKRFNLPKEFEFWKRYDFAMLSKASALHVLQLLGWEHSVGLAHELEFARSISLPVRFIPR